jgi:HAD superfamily hydrolase (TIGR01458 family)
MDSRGKHAENEVAMMDPAAIRAFLIDLDGVVYIDHLLVEEADKTVRFLREKGYILRFATNTTGRSRAAIARKIQTFGIGVEEKEIFSAPYATALWLRQTPTLKCRIMTQGNARHEFDGLPQSEDNPDVIILGDIGERFTFELMNDLFRQILRGARLIALQKNRYWLTGGQLTLDAGPYVAALEYATGTTAQVMGKPSRFFFELALKDLRLQPEQVAIIGDDLEADILGAQIAGLRTIFVESGKDTRADMIRLKIQPDLVLPNIAHLPQHLNR